MHVFIITQYFPPEIGAAASRWGDYAKILIKYGHRVTILCESPNYPNSTYFKGYKNQWVSKEQKSLNLTIIRSKAFASDRSTFLKKILHYFVFMISGFFNSFKIKNYDILIVSSPPLFVGLIGAMLKKFKGMDYWLDVRDLWPESVLELGQLKKGFLYSLGKKLELIIYNSAKGFIFPVPGFKKYLSSKSNHISKKPMLTLLNGVSKVFLNEARSCKLKRDENFTVLYSGNMGLAQNLITIVDAAKLLKDYKIEFRFIGNGVRKKEIQEFSKSLSNKIYFHEPMSRSKLIKWIKKSSICLAPLKRSELFKNALPSKIFEYMACGRPVIVGIRGEIESFISSSKSGICIEPEDPEALASSILMYYNDRKKCEDEGVNGMRYITKYLNKELLISQLLKDLNF